MADTLRFFTPRSLRACVSYRRRLVHLAHLIYGRQLLDFTIGAMRTWRVSLGTAAASQGVRALARIEPNFWRPRYGEAQ
jgi:hypothetical protein